jgi:GTP cyclohydrolase II
MNELVVRRKVSARIPTKHGTFQLMLYDNSRDAREHLAFVMGELAGAEDVLVRVHSECFTGDVLGSVRCDCGEQLERSLQFISRARRGVLLYLRQEGRGIGLLDKLRAYNLQDEGLDTVEANLRLGHKPDEREYGVAAMMLRDLGVRSVNLITNNPTKIRDLRRLGIVVCRRTPIEVAARPENAGYLHTKRSRMDHLLQFGGQFRLSEDQLFHTQL